MDWTSTSTTGEATAIYFPRYLELGLDPSLRGGIVSSFHFELSRELSVVREAKDGSSLHSPVDPPAQANTPTPTLPPSTPTPDFTWDARGPGPDLLPFGTRGEVVRLVDKANYIYFTYLLTTVPYIYIYRKREREA